MHVFDFILIYLFHSRLVAGVCLQTTVKATTIKEALQRWVRVKNCIIIAQI